MTETARQTDEAYDAVVLNSAGVRQGDVSGPPLSAVIGPVWTLIEIPPDYPPPSKGTRTTNVVPANTDRHSIPLPAISPSGVFFRRSLAQWRLGASNEKLRTGKYQANVYSFPYALPVKADLRRVEDWRVR